MSCSRLSASSCRMVASIVANCSGDMFKDGREVVRFNEAEEIEARSSLVMVEAASPSTEIQSLILFKASESRAFVAKADGSTLSCKYLFCALASGILLSSFFVILMNPLRLTSPYHCSLRSWPRSSSKAARRSSRSSCSMSAAACGEVGYRSSRSLRRLEKS